MAECYLFSSHVGLLEEDLALRALVDLQLAAAKETFPSLDVPEDIQILVDKDDALHAPSVAAYDGLGTFHLDYID